MDDYWEIQFPSVMKVGSMFLDAEHGTTPACGGMGGRDIFYAEVQWWDGGGWVTDGTVSGAENYSYVFTTQVTTDRIRLYNVYSSPGNGNAILFEWYIYSAVWDCADPADI
jgi:hypothetical protein